MENRIDLYMKSLSKDVKINGTKFHVKPVITTKNMIEITTLCLNYFENNGRDMKQIPVIKAIFDMMVVYYCSNIRVKGVKISKDNVSLDIKSDDVELFENSLAIEYIKPYIKNYNECFNLLLKTLEMQNVYDSLIGFGNLIPDPDKMSENLKTSLETIAKLQKKDPESFEKIVKEVSTKKIREDSLNEVKAKKKKSK